MRFDKFPKWISESPSFLSISGTAAKILIYLSSARDWRFGDPTMTTVAGLAAAIGTTNRNQVRDALSQLSERKMISQYRKGRTLRIRLLFTEHKASGNSHYLKARSRSRGGFSDEATGRKASTNWTDSVRELDGKRPLVVEGKC